MKISGKHAYCIMAHGNWEQLQMLITALDDERNDIFLHIDKKALDSYKQFGGSKSKHSSIYLIKSYDVRWSDFSQTSAELALFQRVVNCGVEYERVHLISGSDMPLRNQDYIHVFFKGKKEEYLIVRTNKKFSIRIKYYHFFVRYRRKYKFFNILRRILLLVQLPFVDRLKKCPLPYAWGTNWCSLTMKAVNFLCDHKEICQSIFKYSTSSDELYKQMLLNSSPEFSFSSSEEGNLRYVDFSERNPSPKILTIADYDKIMSSGCLFARKFDIHKDKRVVEKILESL